jgi:hypothetical protein
MTSVINKQNVKGGIFGSTQMWQYIHLGLSSGHTRADAGHEGSFTVLLLERDASHVLRGE